MNRRTSIAAGAALALLAGITVWSVHSCRPQKIRAVAERPAAEAPRPTPAQPPSVAPKPTVTPSAAPPQPTGPRPVVIPPVLKPHPQTERCWLLRVTDAGQRATITPSPCGPSGAE